MVPDRAIAHRLHAGSKHKLAVWSSGLILDLRARSPGPIPRTALVLAEQLLAAAAKNYAFPSGLGAP